MSVFFNILYRVLLNMIHATHHNTIYGLFDPTTGTRVCIPPYQRTYGWTNAECHHFFTAIDNPASSHFLGTIFCVKPTDAPVLEIIDGQQRLLSVTLMFAAAYSILDRCKNYETTLHAACLAEMQTLLAFLLLPNTKQPEFRWQPQTEDQADYHFLLSEALGFVTPPASSNLKKRPLYKAFSYWGQAFETIQTTKGVAALLAFLHKVKNSLLVIVEITQETDAAALFATLNHHRLAFTAMDHIKNKFYALTQSHDEQVAFSQQWNTFVHNIGDPKKQALFLEIYYDLFKNELNAPFRTPATREKKYPLGNSATGSYLRFIYETLIDHHADGRILTEIVAASQTYATLLSENTDRWEPLLQNPLKNLAHLQGAPAYILLLYLFERRTQLKLTLSDLEKIIQALTIFFLRRKMTGVPPKSTLTTLFQSIVDEIIEEAKTEDAILILIQKKLASTLAY